MKIFVTAKPNNKHPKVTKLSDNHYIVAVKEPPKDGKANTAIIKALADHLNIPKSTICIKSGQKAKTKLLEVM